MKLRHWIGGALLLLWIGAVGWHVRREYFRSESLILAEGARSLAPGTFFYTVRMNDQTIGLASSRLDTVPGGGFLFEDVLRLELPAMATQSPAVVRTRARLGAALQLLDFEFELESEIGDFRVAGEARSDSVLQLRLAAGSGDQVSNVPMDRTLTLPVAIPLRMAAAGRLDVGQKYTARVFDPSSMSDREVTVEVTGRDMLPVVDSIVYSQRRDAWSTWGYDTIPVWVVEERYGGVAVTSWLDEDGRLVKAESPMGFTLQRTPYELADQAWQRSREDPGAAAGYGAVIENTAIAANADLGGTAGAARLVVRLRDVELEGFDLEGGRQSLRGDTLVVTRETAPFGASYTLPYRVPERRVREDDAPLFGPPGPEALESTPLIQADDPRIVEAAREVAAGATDPAVVASRLNDWVHQRLEKDITLSIPSAVQVLEIGQGDCNEHTVLYVALARALGIPTRTAVGLVHLNGRFYYHAWPEVWLDGWVAVDPTLDQFPADAMHLRFLVGGLARQVELVRLIGRLDLDIVGTS
ncbi:MAG: transglutaminase-like domain-containing protein [Candidatus Longimicrobiales bacterium M2_2A_002]